MPPLILHIWRPERIVRAARLLVFALPDDVIMKATILRALAAMLRVAPVRAAAQPGPETPDAWRRYVGTTEARLPPTRAAPSGANGRDAAQPAGETINVPAGAIHYWRGAVFISGAYLDRVLDRLLQPERGQPPGDQRQEGCWQSHRSSVEPPFCLQCSLQYLPHSPPLVTMQLQDGCAHLAVFGIANLLTRLYPPALLPASSALA